MNLENIILSKISQSQKGRILCDFTHEVPVVPYIKIHRDRKENDGGQVTGKGRMGHCGVVGTEFQSGKVKNAWRWIESLGTQPRESTYCHRT